MARILCQLCNRVVACGETRTCFVFKNNDDVYTLTLLEESNKTDKNHDDTKDKFADNSSKNSLNLIPAASQKEKSQVSCMPASSKIQVSSLLDIPNEESDATLEESKLKSLNNGREVFMHYLEKVTEQIYSDDKIISEDLNLNTNTDFLSVNKDKYNYNTIQEISYEQNSSEVFSDTDDKIEVRVTNRNESMYSKRNEDAVSGPSERRVSNKTFRGEFCAKRFNRESNLNNNNKGLVEDETAAAETSGTFDDCNATGMADKRFVCDMCKMQFSHKGNIVKHWRTHTGEKPFVCDICGKRFTLEHHFDLHYRKHTGEKPFVCEECKKSFC